MKGDGKLPKAAEAGSEIRGRWSLGLAQYRSQTHRNGSKRTLISRLL